MSEATDSLEQEVQVPETEEQDFSVTLEIGEHGYDLLNVEFWRKGPSDEKGRRVFAKTPGAQDAIISFDLLFKQLQNEDCKTTFWTISKSVAHLLLTAMRALLRSDEESGRRYICALVSIYDQLKEALD